MVKQKDNILYHIKSLYDSNVLYSRLDDNVIVAINSNHNRNQNQNQNQQSLEYVTEYKNTTLSKTLPYHLFQTVNQCYLHMRRTAIDQSILLRFFFFFCEYPFSL